MSSKKLLPLVISLLVSPAYAATFVIEKNNQLFSIDGNNGAKEGQQIYLWNTDEENVDQQWVQISHGDGYYSYKKEDTNLCWDGGDDGAKRQAITLETCDSSNYDQHWGKVKITSGSETYRFEKRNTNFSIDGNRNGANNQAIYLWTSSNSNVNQQWNLASIDSTNGVDNEDVTASDNAMYLQHSDSGLYYTVNSSGQLIRTASSTSDAQGLERVSNSGGVSLKAVGGEYDGLYSYEPSGSTRQVMGADLSDAEVFFETSCDGDDVYFTSGETGDNLKNESNNMLGNGSGGNCSSNANTFTWVAAASSSGSTISSSGSTASYGGVPYDYQRYQDALDNANLQQSDDPSTDGSSKSDVVDAGGYEDYESEYFYIDNDSGNLTFEMSGDRNRAELRFEENFLTDLSDTYYVLSADLLPVEPRESVKNSTSGEEITLLQVHNKGTRGKTDDTVLSHPLLRVVWDGENRKDDVTGRSYSGAYWAIMKINAYECSNKDGENYVSNCPDSYSNFYLGSFTEREYIDVDITVGNSKLIVDVDGDEKLNYNIDYWEDLYSYFKAGVYNQYNNGNSIVKFSTLTFDVISE